MEVADQDAGPVLVSILFQDCSGHVGREQIPVGHLAFCGLPGIYLPNVNAGAFGLESHDRRLSSYEP